MPQDADNLMLVGDDAVHNPVGVSRTADMAFAAVRATVVNHCRANVLVLEVPSSLVLPSK